MTRREALQFFGAAASLAIAPAFVTLDDPMGLLGLVDDSTYAPIVYAQSLMTGQTWGIVTQDKARFARWLVRERESLEHDASEQFGRPIRFEVLDFDGQNFLIDRDLVRILFVERPA